MASSSKKIVYLVEAAEEISDEKLPSIGAILSFFVFRTDKSVSHKLIADLAYLRIREIWEEKAGIYKLKRRDSVKTMLLHLFREYVDLKNGRNAKSDAQRDRENLFKEKLNKLFDIASIYALDEIKDETIKHFLKKQKEKGPLDELDIIADMWMGRTRKVGVITDPNIDSREELESMCSASSASASPPEAKDDPDFDLGEPKNPTGPRKPKVKKQELITDRIVGVLDRYKIRDRGATHLIVAILLSLRKDPKQYKISMSTISKRRKNIRKNIYEKIREDLKLTRTSVVHFDDKLMEVITGREKVDHMAVKVTCGDVDQLLGVPTCDGTGIDTAAVVYDCLENWKAVDKIEACCFDTTSTNTGVENGAAVFLEQFLGRNLLWLPCRHHIFELVLKVVFEAKVELPSGPQVKIFKRFRKEWDSFDKTKYTPGTDNYKVNHYLRGHSESTKKFIEQQMELELQKKDLRDDYYELLELSYMFLGGKLKKKDNRVTFHPPGADHHARWMSKAIYSLKIYLFHTQFKLSKKLLDGFAAVNVFIIRFYLRVWFQCSLPTKAASLDLQFLKDIVQFYDTDKDLAALILQKFSGHLWYLSEEAVAMAFFDENISTDVKREMVKKLCLSEVETSSDDKDTSLEMEMEVDEAESESEVPDSPEQKHETESSSDVEWDEDFDIYSDSESETEYEGDGEDEGSSRGDDEYYKKLENRVVMKVDEIIKTIEKKNISDFVTKNTYQFFRRFQIHTEFLQTDPLFWEVIDCKSYKKAKDIVKMLKIVNDTAERGVQLMQEYLNLLSKDELQTMYILQVVAEHRKIYKSDNIKDLASVP